MKILPISFLLATLLTQGCASMATKPFVYDSTASKALNISRSAGLIDGLKDTKLPKDTVTDIRNSVGFATAHAISTYNTPAGGISGNTASSLAIASWLLAPESPSAKNRIFAWMPFDSSDRPVDSLTDILLKATVRSLEDLGYATASSKAKGKNIRAINVVFFDGPNNKCVKTDSPPCSIIFLISSPKKLESTPGFAGIPDNPNWVFDAKKPSRSKFYFKGVDDLNINQAEIVQSISKNMPEWFYLYLAPNKISTGNEFIKSPVVLDNGKFEYFVTTK